MQKNYLSAIKKMHNAVIDSLKELLWLILAMRLRADKIFFKYNIVLLHFVII